MSELDINIAILIKTGTADLNFDSITHIAEDAAQFLIESKIFPKLDGLVNIPVHTAKFLYYGYNCLSLRHVKSLCGSSARILIHGENDVGINNFNYSRKRSLLLDGLSELSSELAEILSAFRGDLSLNGLTKINDTESAFFANHSGSLYLNKIPSLSDESCRLLSEHKDALYLKGLDEASHTGVDFLMENCNICFNAYRVKLGISFKWPPPENSEYLNKLPIEIFRIYSILRTVTLDITWLEKRINSLTKGSNFLLERLEEMRKLQYNFEEVYNGIEYVWYDIQETPPSIYLTEKDPFGGPSRAEAVIEQVYSLRYKFKYLRSIWEDSCRAMM